MLIEFIKIFVISFLFFGMFFIQKYSGNVYYFGFGEIVYGFRTSLKPLAVILKFLMIICFTFIIQFFFRNELQILLGVFLGSFLIVWPAILNPEHIDYRLRNRRKVVYLIYFCFIIASIYAGYWGIKLNSILTPIIKGYFKQLFTVNRIVPFIIDGVLFSGLVVFFTKLNSILNKEIKTRYDEYDFDQEDE